MGTPKLPSVSAFDVDALETLLLVIWKISVWFTEQDITKEVKS